MKAFVFGPWVLSIRVRGPVPSKYPMNGYMLVLKRLILYQALLLICILDNSVGLWRN